MLRQESYARKREEHKGFDSRRNPYLTDYEEQRSRRDRQTVPGRQGTSGKRTGQNPADRWGRESYSRPASARSIGTGGRISHGGSAADRPFLYEEGEEDELFLLYGGEEEGELSLLYGGEEETRPRRRRSDIDEKPVYRQIPRRTAVRGTAGHRRMAGRRARRKKILRRRLMVGVWMLCLLALGVAFVLRNSVTAANGGKEGGGFLDAMEKNGLKVRQDHIYQGFFTMDSGMQAVETFLKDGGRPRAIICGNDAMAVGAQEALRQHGLRVPEDVILAGFDNSELSELSYPPLTSVDKNQHEVGYRAVYEIMSRVEGSPPNGTAVTGEPILRTSCGCPFEEEQNARKLRESYVHNQISTQNGADILRNMITEFSGLGTPEDVVEALKKYVEQMEFESFYLCFCEKDRLFAIQDETLTGALDILHGNTEYTDMIHIPLAYENGVFASYENFPRGKVLPEECRTKSGGNYYVAVPIFYQHCCYGYCISGNTHLPLEHNFFYAWIMNIGIGFENIRKRVLLEDTVKRLNSMWAYDMLTRLYNRAGFFHYAERMLRDLQQEDEYVCLVFLDLDGLKQVNDTIGHEAGDELIGSMAEIIRQNIEEGSLAMRYGGDEFVILGRCAGEGITERFVAALREGMQRRNRRSNTSVMK